MASKSNILSVIYVVLSAVTLLALIGFVGNRESEQTFEKLNIRIDYVDGNNFIDDEDVVKLITQNGAEHIVGMKYNEVQLKDLEERVRKNAFVQGTQAYKDHQGNLVVEVTQCRPIARLVRTNDYHAYLGDNGNVIGMSHKFTPRVLIIDGAYVKNLMDERFLKGDTGKTYLQLVKYIEKDDFWKAQISQLTIDQYGDITMMPQVGSQVIRFGTTEDMMKKFARLKIFYSKIIPVKGWDAYKEVNVKYKDQIICE